MELTILLIRPATPVTLLDQIEEGGEDVELRRLGVILLEDTTAGGEVVVLDSICRAVALDRTIAHAHRRVSIARHGLGGVLLLTTGEVEAIATVDRFVEWLQFGREAHVDRPYLRREEDGGVLAQDLCGISLLEGSEELILVGDDTLSEEGIGISLGIPSVLLVDDVEDRSDTLSVDTLTDDVQHSGKDLLVEGGDIVLVELVQALR